MAKSNEASLPELSRLVPVETLVPGETRHFDIIPTRAECLALAEQLELVALDTLEASVDVTPQSGNCVIMNATLRAVVTQTCVVTLEPLKNEIQSELSLKFVPEHTLQSEPSEPEIYLDLETGEVTEPYEEGIIDIGKAIAEQLALEIDRFPRAKGASFEDYSTKTTGGDDNIDASRPFDVLKSRQQGRQKDQ